MASNISKTNTFIEYLSSEKTDSTNQIHRTSLDKFPSGDKSVVPQLDVAKAVVSVKGDIDKEKINKDLMKAVKQGDYEKCKELIEQGADVNCELCPLHKAVYNGAYEICKLLLECNAKVNKQDSDNDTPLHLASDPQICKLLIEKGAYVNAKNDSFHTPLQAVMALYQKATVDKGRHYFEIFKLLLEHGADIDTQDDKGNSLLHMAVAVNDAEQIEFLLKKGARVNIINKWKNSPLHRAVIKKNHKSIQILLDHGADVNLADKTGDTPLHLALQIGDQEAIQILLDNDANVNRKNEDGETPATLSKFLQIPLKTTQEVFARHSHYNKEFVLRKFLGHAFSIEGKSSLNEDIHIDLEGAHERYFWRKFHKSLDLFACRFEQAERKAITTISQACQAASKNLSAEQICEAWKAGDPVILNTGFKEHHVAVLFWDNQLVICNAGPKGVPGIKDKIKTHAVFNIDKEKLTTKVIQKIISQFDNKEKTFTPFFENLIEELHGEEIVLKELIIPRQRIGNCTYENSLGMVFPMLVLSICKTRGIELTPENAREINKVTKKQRGIYETWKSSQQLNVVRRYLTRCIVADIEYLEPERHRYDLSLLRKAIIAGYKEAFNNPDIIKEWEKKILEYDLLVKRFNKYAEDEEIPDRLEEIIIEEINKEIEDIGSAAIDKKVNIYLDESINDIFRRRVGRQVT